MPWEDNGGREEWFWGHGKGTRGYGGQEEATVGNGEVQRTEWRKSEVDRLGRSGAKEAA